MKKRFKYYWSIFIKPQLWWILLAIILCHDLRLFASLYACYMLIQAITTIGNPKAIYYQLLEENAKKKEKKLKSIIEIVLIVLCAYRIYSAFCTSYRFIYKAQKMVSKKYRCSDSYIGGCFQLYG